MIFSLPNVLHYLTISVLTSCKYFLTDGRLITIDFDKNDILKIIRNLNVNKANGHDISIRMLKICDSVSLNPYLFYLRTALIVEYFPMFGKCLISYRLIKKMINVI